MIELAAFIILLAVLCIFDIRSMIIANKKKVLLPYLSLTAVTLIISIIYLINPYRESISYFLIKLLGLEG